MYLWGQPVRLKSLQPRLLDMYSRWSTQKGAMITITLIMPPGTIVPMGAYCLYCVRMYVLLHICI